MSFSFHFFVGKLFEKSFPTPLQKLSHSRYPNRAVSLRRDGRRERKVRFCCRKRSGATETLPVKRVVLPQHRSTDARLPFWVYNSALCTSLLCTLSNYPTFLFYCQEKPLDTNGHEMTEKRPKRADVCVFLSHVCVFLRHLSNNFSPLS